PAVQRLADVGNSTRPGAFFMDGRMAKCATKEISGHCIGPKTQAFYRITLSRQCWPRACRKSRLQLHPFTRASAAATHRADRPGWIVPRCRAVLDTAMESV